MSRHRHVRNMDLDDYDDEDYYSEEEDYEGEEGDEDETEQVAYVAYTAPSKGNTTKQPIQSSVVNVSLVAVRNVMNIVGPDISSDAVKAALLKYGGNEERAINCLLEGGNQNGLKLGGGALGVPSLSLLYQVGSLNAPKLSSLTSGVGLQSKPIPACLD
ncbi:UNVERIFIED_CONTAM: hypothetical protein HDU68_004465 [Siphonaria sp. JEL0065]|nr:hypothetical protein HDU68_004465 [Siphonaria sp. JEL0065]